MKHQTTHACFIYRAMTRNDLFHMNNVNLDVFTENFELSFYESYLSEFPGLCIVAESINGDIAGYIIGRIQDIRCHVSALTVSPEYRRCGLAHSLMKRFETMGIRYGCVFTDLHVRCSNLVAVNFYKNFGYSVYKEVKQYYSDGGNAYDMRKYFTNNLEKNSP